MRTDRRYGRVRTMITDPSIPRNESGLLRLCHSCQREVYWAKGFLRLLARRLEHDGKFFHSATPAWAFPITATDDEEAAFEQFCRLRWPDTEGKPVCPYCGNGESYRLKRQRRFSCAACHRQFSATTSTPFAYRKIGFVQLLSVLGSPHGERDGLQMGRTANVNGKSGYRLAHIKRRIAAPELP